MQGNAFPIPTTAHPHPHIWNVGDFCGQDFFTLTFKNGRSVCIQEDVQVHTDISLDRHGHTGVCVCVLVHPLRSSSSFGAEAAAGHCWQQEPAGCAGQGLSFTPLECAIQVAKADNSTVPIWLRVFLCPMSLVQCALLSRAQAPLLNPLLVFRSVCLVWVSSPGTCQHESGGSHPPFQPLEHSWPLW